MLRPLQGICPKTAGLSGMTDLNIFPLDLDLSLKKSSRTQADLAAIPGFRAAP